MKIERSRRWLIVLLLIVITAIFLVALRPYHIGPFYVPRSWPPKFFWMPKPHWIDPEKAPSPVKLDGGNCLDLKRLPNGWKVSSDSTHYQAIFGLPGDLGSTTSPLPHYLEIIAAATGHSNVYSAYAYQSVTEDGHERSLSPDEETYLGHHRQWDVPGFHTHPADDGEIIYVGVDVDAVMECNTDPKFRGCRIFDGIKARPVSMSVSIRFDDRANAANRLTFARRILNSLKVRC